MGHYLGEEHAACGALKWRGPELNRRPPAYEADELPSCSTALGKAQRATSRALLSDRETGLPLRSRPVAWSSLVLGTLRLRAAAYLSRWMPAKRVDMCNPCE